MSKSKLSDIKFSNIQGYLKTIINYINKMKKTIQIYFIKNKALCD